MKSIKKFAAIAILALGLTFTSCSSDDGESGIPFAKEGTITAQVGGKTLTTLMSNTAAILEMQGEVGLLYMTGFTVDDELLSIVISDYTGPGTYVIDGVKGSKDAGVVYGRNGKDPNNYQSWNAQFTVDGSRAKIIIAEQTEKVVKGTFSFKGKNDQDGTFQEIKNGSFFIKLNQ